MPPKPSYVEPPPTQSDLSKFLGKQQLPRQQTLGAMSKKAGPVAAAPPVADDGNAMQVDDGAVVILSGDEEEGEEAVQAVRPKKRPTVAVSSDEDEDAPPKASSSAKKLKKDSTPAAEPVIKKAPTPSPAKERSTAPSPKPKAAPAADKKPPVSSFFAPKPKPQPKEAAPASSSGKEKKLEKGKGKAESVEPEHKEEQGDEAEVFDSESDEEDDEAAGQLADIFTRKASTAKGAKDRVDWKAGAPVPYQALTDTFDLISQTTKRLEISAFLTQFLVEVIQKTPDDLLKVVYLCINSLCPAYESLKLGVAEAFLMKAIGLSTGRKPADIKADYRKVGDLGSVAQTSRNKQKTLFQPKRLTIASVFTTLRDIAKVSGDAAQSRKVGLINKLLAACVGSETKFLIRSLEGKLRIGLAEKTVLVSLAHAAVTAAALKEGKQLSKERMKGELEVGAEIVKAVFSELPSYDVVIPVLLEKGVHKLKESCFLTPGVPLKPMLAKPTKAITEVLDRFEGKKFTCEYKYDGERAQVHFLEDGSIKVFSRNSEDMSVKYPDLVEQLPRCIKEGVKSFVIDCEAVAWEPDDKRLLPFQDLSRRKRKDVKAEDIKVRVHLFAFDLLYLDGKPLLAENLERRRELLHETLQPVEGEFAFAMSEDATSVEAIQIFLDKSIKDGCEGLMVKMLEGEGASYEPSRRSVNWLKLKKDYLAGVGDSFDLVVIGADHGKGKRLNVYGAFHLACKDHDGEGYQAICKIGTGFSDEDLKSHFEALLPYIRDPNIKPNDYEVPSGGSYSPPDVWFEPKVVWEVLAADLSLSPIYTAGIGLCDDGRGISLRFPRFLRVRDDKAPEDATDGEFVADAYRRQATTAPKGKGKKEDDEGGFW